MYLNENVCVSALYMLSVGLDVFPTFREHTISIMFLTNETAC